MVSTNTVQNDSLAVIAQSSDKYYIFWNCQQNLEIVTSKN
jgi:hypothetical protein